MYLNIEALERANLKTDPFEYVVVTDFVNSDFIKEISADYPVVPGPGSHPPRELNIHGHFKNLMDELNGGAFRQAVESKFGLDLSNYPTMYTVRGYLRDTDGQIHTDSKTKIITVLLYLNEDWGVEGGKLRLLRNGTDLEDYVEEVPPKFGTLLIFKRSDNSWHGHKPFEGKRRTIQMNWVTSQDVVDKEQRRHARSTKLKRFIRFFAPAEADGAASSGQ